MSPFLDKELQKLSQDIINRALGRQTGTASPNLLVDRLRQAIRKPLKQPKV